MSALPHRIEPIAPAEPATTQPSRFPAPTVLSVSWSVCAQWATAALALGLFLGVGLTTFLSSLKQPEITSPDVRIDLNRTSPAALAQLPGVGPKLAERIVAHRQTHGDYRRFEDLRQVPGIGPAMLERLRPAVFVDEASADDSVTSSLPVSPRREVPEGPISKTKSKKEVALAGVTININLATATELQKLPGIGPKLSQRIVDYREKQFFQSVDDLRQVSGIGPKTLDKIRAYVRTDDDGPGLLTQNKK